MPFIEGSMQRLFFQHSVTLAPSDILALHTTPVEIIPAPGAGKMIQPLLMLVELKFNSQAYDATNVSSLNYGPGDEFGIGKGILEVTESSFLMDVSWAGILQALPRADWVNVPWTINAGSGNPTGGNSSLRLTVVYQIFDVF